MEVIYSGKEVKRLLKEDISGFKPVFGNDSLNKSGKINKQANKDSLKNVELNIDKEESKPKLYDNQSTDLGNNKNMLDLEYDNDPGKEFHDMVKKQVTGEKSEFGNAPEDSAPNTGNKAFYDAAKKATKDIVKAKQDLENSGLTGKNLPVPKKDTPFKESTEQKVKRLNYKNTQFLSERHMFSLIPEDYKKAGNKFIMKDKMNEEYIIEWKVDEKTKISEGIVVGHENKKRLQEEFDRMKNLYSYKSKDTSGKMTNVERVNEEKEVSINLDKVRKFSDEE